MPARVFFPFNEAFSRFVYVQNIAILLFELVRTCPNLFQDLLLRIDCFLLLLFFCVGAYLVSPYFVINTPSLAFPFNSSSGSKRPTKSGKTWWTRAPGWARKGTPLGVSTLGAGQGWPPWWGDCRWWR